MFKLESWHWKADSYQNHAQPLIPTLKSSLTGGHEGEVADGGEPNYSADSFTLQQSIVSKENSHLLKTNQLKQLVNFKIPDHY